MNLYFIWFFLLGISKFWYAFSYCMNFAVRVTSIATAMIWYQLCCVNFDFVPWTMKYSEMKFYQHGCHQKRDAKLWFRMGLFSGILPNIKKGNALRNPKRRLCATHSGKGTVVVRPMGCFGLMGFLTRHQPSFFFLKRQLPWKSQIVPCVVHSSYLESELWIPVPKDHVQHWD